MKILLMEDDPVLGDIIAEHLSLHYQTDHAFDSQEAIEFLELNRYDLLIFDINVPGQSGIELLNDLREYHDNTPAIIITAYEDTKHLKESFDAGAHDYIRKPFELEELTLRIEKSKALFNIEQNSIMQISDEIKYSQSERKIYKKDKTIVLKPKEAKILEYFLGHKNRAISNDELIQNIWSYETMPTDATIRSHIRNLRSIIGNHKITTLRSIGYRYE